MMHDNDEAMLSRDDRDWDDYLTRFNTHVWLKLKRYGFSKDTLLIMWELNAMNGRLKALEEALVEKDDYDG